MSISVCFRDILDEREIQREWVERTEREPEHIDERDDGTRHFIRRIPENGNRWLRVVVKLAVAPNRPVTGFSTGDWGENRQVPGEECHGH